MAALGLALVIPASASASLPWIYAGGTFTYTYFDLQVENPTASTQTVQFFNTQHTVPANGVVTLASSSVGCGGGCTALLDFASSSPDVAPFATAVIAVNGATAPIYIGPGQFRVIGPGGSVDTAVSTLASANATAFGSLQSATTAMQSLLGGVPGALGRISAALGAPASSPLAGQLQALTAKVDTLTARVTALTKALSPKKPAKKRKR
jgi:hypothetical protein